MKIAYIAPSTIPSATANSVQVMKVCQALTQLGHDVTLYVPGKEYSDQAELKSFYGLISQFPINWLPFTPSLRKIDFAWKAVNLARKSNSEVIYTRLLWVAVLAQSLRLPVILEMHEVPSGHLGPILYRRYLLHKGKKLTIFITAALKKAIESKLGITHKIDESSVAPDGVDLERYEGLHSAKEARKLLGLPDRFTAVYSGGFYPGRGLEILLDLAKAFPEVQFLCIGGKSDSIQLWQKKVDELNLKNFILTGYVANEKLPLYQSAADILLLPYHRQVAGSSGGDIANVTSPMKVFEYMACGRAILCSDLPVLHEVLNDRNAAFYPPEDLQSFINMFEILQNDRKLRSTLGDRARQDVVKYSWKARMSGILAYFNNR